MINRWSTVKCGKIFVKDLFNYILSSVITTITATINSNKNNELRTHEASTKTIERSMNNAVTLCKFVHWHIFERYLSKSLFMLDI